MTMPSTRKDRGAPPAAFRGGRPPAQGLYDPRFEHDSCGVGFVVNIKGERSHKLVRQAFEVGLNLLHRGACGCEVNTGDGAGMLLQVPHKFLAKAAPAAGIELPAAGGVRRSEWCSCRRTRRSGAASRISSPPSSPRKGSACSAGATCRPTARRSGRPRAAASR